MNAMNRDNLNHIKSKFELKTGVEITKRRYTKRPVKIAVLLLAMLLCFLTLAAFAKTMFSSLAGDELSFSSHYEGNGVITIEIENKSDKELVFQESLKLMLWSTAEEIIPTSNQIAFEGTAFAPHSSGIMTIDLSAAYDIELLEQPLTNDHYYVVLTNNNFIFGQDWMCTIKFAETIVIPDAPVPPVVADEAIIQGIEESLQFYFEEISFDIDARIAMNAEYKTSYTNLFEHFDGRIISSVLDLSLIIDDQKEVIFDSTVPAEEQHLLIGQHWLSSDKNFKLLATEEEEALVISAELSSERGVYIPLFYIFTYDKSSLDTIHYIFIYGRIISVADMEQYLVYEDEQYLCYEVHDLIYADLDEHIRSFISQNPDVQYDERAQARLMNIYHYYEENLGELFYYRQF